MSSDPSTTTEPSVDEDDGGFGPGVPFDRPCSTRLAGSGPKGIAPVAVGISWHYGHWAYGSTDVVVNCQTVPGDKTRGRGLVPNPAVRVDGRQSSEATETEVEHELTETPAAPQDK